MFCYEKGQVKVRLRVCVCIKEIIWIKAIIRITMCWMQSLKSLDLEINCPGANFLWARHQLAHVFNSWLIFIARKGHHLGAVGNWSEPPWRPLERQSWSLSALSITCYPLGLAFSGHLEIASLWDKNRVWQPSQRLGRLCQNHKPGSKESSSIWR